MYYEDSSTSLSFLTGLLVGAAIGAGAALLLAPQSGKRTRRRLVRAVSDAREGATDRWEGLTDDVGEAVRQGRRRLRL